MFSIVLALWQYKIVAKLLGKYICVVFTYCCLLANLLYTTGLKGRSYLEMRGYFEGGSYF